MSEASMMTISMRDAERAIPRGDLRRLFGDKVMVYTGRDPGTYLDCGCVLRYNREQEVYHRSTSIDMAIAASWRIDSGYGWSGEHEAAELARLGEWIARERYLIYWCVDWPRLSARDRKRFAAACQEMALEMGRPINGYKREMLAGTLRARTGSTEAMEDLRDAAEAGMARIFQIEGIAPFIDMRRVALFRELDRELMVLARRSLRLSAAWTNAPTIVPCMTWLCVRSWSTTSTPACVAWTRWSTALCATWRAVRSATISSLS